MKQKIIVPKMKNHKVMWPVFATMYFQLLEQEYFNKQEMQDSKTEKELLRHKED